MKTCVQLQFYMWCSALTAMSKVSRVLQNGGKRAKFRPSGKALGSVRLMFFSVRSSHNSQKGKTYRPGEIIAAVKREEREATLLTTFSQRLWSNGVWMYTFSIAQDRNSLRHHWFNQRHTEKERFVTRISCLTPPKQWLFWDKTDSMTSSKQRKWCDLWARENIDFSAKRNLYTRITSTVTVLNAIWMVSKSHRLQHPLQTTKYPVFKYNILQCLNFKTC